MTFDDLDDIVNDHPDTAIPCRASGFTVGGQWTADTEERQQAAAAACAPCPTRITCRAFGLDHPREHGTYGGLTEWERRHLARAARNTPKETP